MSIKSIYLSDDARPVWDQAQVLCKRRGGSLSGILTQFLHTWVKSQGLTHPAIAATEKTPENLIEQIESRLAELKQQLADQKEAS